MIFRKVQKGEVYVYKNNIAGKNHKNRHTNRG